MLEAQYRTFWSDRHAGPESELGILILTLWVVRRKSENASDSFPSACHGQWRSQPTQRPLSDHPLILFLQTQAAGQAKDRPEGWCVLCSMIQCSLSPPTTPALVNGGARGAENHQAGV